MSYWQTLTSLSPVAFAPREPITSDDLTSVVEMMNWTFARRPQVHIDTTCTLFRLPAVNPMQIFFPRAASGYYTIFYFPVWISSEAITIGFGATVYCHATPSPTVRIRWTFDGATATQDYTTATNGVEQNKTFTLVGKTESWVPCQMEIMTVSTGTTMTAATSAYVHSVRVQEYEVAEASMSPSTVP